MFFLYIEFYPNCKVYYPPLSWDCIASLWLDVFECNENGTRYPGLLDEKMLEKLWTNITLRSNFKKLRKILCIDIL